MFMCVCACIMYVNMVAHIHLPVLISRMSRFLYRFVAVTVYILTSFFLGEEGIPNPKLKFVEKH